jgi:hypothetical protein
MQQKERKKDRKKERKKERKKDRQTEKRNADEIYDETDSHFSTSFNFHSNCIVVGPSSTNKFLSILVSLIKVF